MAVARRELRRIGHEAFDTVFDIDGPQTCHCVEPPSAPKEHDARAVRSDSHPARRPEREALAAGVAARKGLVRHGTRRYSVRDTPRTPLASLL